MNSLQELNNFNNSINFVVTDNRLATVKLNTNVFYDKEISISSTTIQVVPTFDIIEIVNYATADCRFRIKINSSAPAFIAASTITWASLPAHISLTSSGGVYTLSGLRTSSDWDAVKNPTWTLPGNYATYSKFWITVSVIYYDEELALTVTKEIDIFDKDFYYSVQCDSLSTLTCSPNAIANTITTLSAVVTITAIGTDVTQSAYLPPAVFGVTCVPTVIPIQFVARNTTDGTKAFKAYAYDLNSQDYISSITPLRGPLQDGVSKIRMAKNGLVAVGAFVYDYASSQGVVTLSFFKPNTSGSFDWVYTIEAFDFMTVPRNQYKISDFKFRDDGYAIMLGGNFNSGAEIWSISENFVFTRQKNISSNTAITGRVALHPSGTWAAHTQNWDRNTLPVATNVVRLLKWNGTEWLQNNYTSAVIYAGSGLVQGTDQTADLAWDPSGDYFSLSVNLDTNRIYHFNPNTTLPTFTLLTTIPLTHAGRTIKWSNSGTYIAIHTVDNKVYIRKRVGTGISATFNAITSFNIAGIQDLDWKFDDTVLTVATTTGFKNIYRSSDTFTYDATTNITDNTTTVAWRKQ